MNSMIDYRTSLDEVIIIGLTEGSQGIRSWVYDHYSPALYGKVVKRIKDPELASKCLLDVFIRIFKLDGYVPGSGLFIWFARITIETISSYNIDSNPFNKN